VFALDLQNTFYDPPAAGEVFLTDGRSESARGPYGVRVTRTHESCSRAMAAA
jgi:hypothetical protein